MHSTDDVRCRSAKKCLNSVSVIQHPHSIKPPRRL